MFLCEDCLTTYYFIQFDDGSRRATSSDFEYRGKSRGGCENCDTGSICVDIPSKRLYHQDSFYAKKIDGRYKPVRVENDSIIVDSNHMDVDVLYRVTYDGKEFGFKNVGGGKMDVYTIKPNQKVE